MWIFSRPLEHPEPRGGREQKRFSSAIKVLWYHDRGRHKRPKDVVINVLDAEEGGSVSACAASPVEAREAEPVRGGGVDQSPVWANQPGWQVLREAPHEIAVQDLSLPDQLWVLRCVEAEGGHMSQWRPGLVSQGPVTKSLDLNQNMKTFPWSEGRHNYLISWSGSPQKSGNIRNPGSHHYNILIIILLSWYISLYFTFNRHSF